MSHGYDHDHLTDIVRAALCSHHNNMLKSAGDQPASLRKLADWLENANLGFLFTDYTTARIKYNNDKPETKARKQDYKSKPENRARAVAYAKTYRLRHE